MQIWCPKCEDVKFFDLQNEGLHQYGVVRHKYKCETCDQICVVEWEDWE